jgi:hypothetical protein
MLSTIISIIDTSSIKLLKDKDLNDAMKILFFSNGLIAQFCNAIAKDLKSPSKNANFIAENFAQKIKDNIVISTQKIFVAEVEEIITPLLSKLILNSIENPIKLNFISNKLVKNYNVIIPQKNLNDTLFFKLNYSLAMNFKTNLYLYNEQEIVDNEISGFIVSVPLLLKEKNTEIEKFKILAFPLTSFCLSGLQILSKLSFKSLPIKTSHQDELVISTCKLLKTIDSEFKNNYESLVIIHQNKRLDQAIEIFFDKLPELGLEILDIIISTCLHWAFKMPSLLKTFDKLFTTINFMYLANKYQKMVEKNFDCQSIKTKLLEAFENLQSGDIKAAQQEFDLISNNIELQAYKGCVIYNFAHYKTLLAQELNQIDKNKVKKINSTKIKADEEVWINKLSSGFSMLAFVIARVDFNHIIFNKDTELNEAIKSLLVDNGFCYELFISLSNDLKLSLTKGGMITNSSFDNLVKALIIDAEKIILPELLEILLPVIEEVIFDISGESHVIKNALIEWLECIGVKIIELIDQDNCILSTLTTIAKKINDVDSSNLIIDDLEVGGNSFEIN